MAKRVARIIVEALAEAGVKRCYGVVGDTMNLIADELRDSAIDWVHVRHEEVAGFAAGGEALITGDLVACAGSCGPGSVHFINGLMESHRNRAPVLLIATQVATAEMGTDFPQEVDLKALYKPFAHFCEYISHPSQARRLTTLAAQTALAKRGLAVIIVPGDVTALRDPDAVPFSVHRARPVIRPNDAELAATAAILNSGSRVGIYCGSGVEGGHDAVVALADRLKAPVAHTSRAKDFIEYDNPFNVGMTGMLGGESGYHMMQSCDTLLLLGADFAWRQFYPDKARIVQVDIDGTHLGRRHPVELGLVGDIKATAEALLPLVAARTDRGFLDDCLKLREKSLEQLAAQERPGSGDLIHPQYVAHLLNKHAAEDAIFTADGGSPMVWLLRHVHANGKRRTLTSLVHGTMANAMPQALGIKKSHPDRQVISMSGDGGVTMLLGDLLTAVQENIPIKVVVFNNGTLGFVEMEQKVEGMLDTFTDLKNPDFARLAEVIGFLGRRVERHEELERAMLDVLAHDGPALLDVRVNRMELVMPPTIEAGEVLHTALYSAKAVLAGRGSDVFHLVENNFLR